MASFAIGLGPVFWLMISKIYPLGMRSHQLVDVIGRPGTFWLYAGFGVLAFAYFAWRLPETKDKSLEQIGHELGADPTSLGRPRRQPAHA